MRLILLLAIPLLSLAGVTSAQLYLTDLNTVKTQMETFYLDSSRFTTIENLDDTVSGTVGRPWQAINQGGGALLVYPYEGFPRRTFLADWQGPYISWNGARDYETASGDYDEGAPMDLNGTSSIYFYTPLGLLDPRQNDVTLRYYGDDFGQYAIVTHGANGVFDGNLSQSVPGDDVGIAIPGFQVTIPVVSSARRSTGTKGVGGPWQVVIKGQNLGTQTGSAEVLANSLPAGGAVVSWTTTRIELSLPTEPPLGTTFTVRLSGGTTAERSATLMALGDVTTVGDWSVY